MGHPIAYGKNFHAEFVSWDAGVSKKGHFTEVSAKVSSADADTLDANERLARAGRRRFGNIDAKPAKGFFELEGFHKKGC
jgi:hypothetical protein